MKTYSNRQTNIGTDPKVEYIDLAVTCLEDRPQAGLTIEDMGIRLSLIKKLREAQKEKKESVELEDAEAAKLLACIKGMDGKWAVLSEDILAFDTDAKKELA